MRSTLSAILLTVLSATIAVSCASSNDVTGTRVIPTGAGEFTIEGPRNNEGPVIKASDYGFNLRSDKNASAINAALIACRQTGASRLELEPGTYRCFDEPGILMENLSDFVLDGKGAVLVFQRAPEYRGQPQSELILDKGNICIRNCDHSRIENMTMDWDWENDPLAASVIVQDSHIDVDRPEQCYVDFLLKDYDRYPAYPNAVPVQKFYPMDSTWTRFRDGGAPNFGQTEGHFGARNEWVRPNVLRVWPGIPMEGRNQNPATGFKYSPEKNLALSKSFKIGSTYRLQHCYYGKNAINMDSNTHLTVKDVTIWACFGMGMVVDGAQEHWQVENFRVVPPTREDIAKAYPGRRFFERPITSTSDGHHVARSRGWCKYIGCRWDRNNDDASNFHDRFTIAVRACDSILTIINARGYDYFRAKVGAEIELRNPDFSETGFRAHLTRIDKNNLYLDATLPEQKGQCFLVWDRDYGTDHILISDCEFEDISGRTVFGNSDITIENCLFRRTNHTPIKMVADYQADRWCEGYGVRNVIIRGCTFEENCTSRRKEGVIVSRAGGPSSWEIGKIDAGFVGGDILIENNEFIRPIGPILDMNIGRNVIFRNNTIDLRNNKSATEKAGMLIIEGVENPLIENNTILKD